MYRYLLPTAVLLTLAAIAAPFKDRALQSSINGVQPLTGIVLWTDNQHRQTDAIQLEYSYMLYDQVVSQKGVYDWSAVENLLTAVAGRSHQAILRFRFVYPGYATAVPAYIKALADYNETQGTSEGRTTWFPDWTHQALQDFTLEFYARFAEKYDPDPRLAFIQTGFGLWAEYHIYDGPFILGTTFPSKAFQEQFFRHLDTTFINIPWSISIDAADDSYSPFSNVTDLQDIDFGLFDDSFMHQNHGGYNTSCWNFFNRERYLRSPAGGEFSYYTQYDQEHVLDTTGIHGVTFEQASADFHISYMIGNDQPDYQSLGRIKQAGRACGYKFQIVSFKTSAESSLVEVKNTGVAPIYYNAFVAVNGVRVAQSLKFLGPGAVMACRAGSGGDNPILTIESDKLVTGQRIEYEADLAGAGISPYVASLPGKIPALTGHQWYTLSGQLIRELKNLSQHQTNSLPPGVYFAIIKGANEPNLFIKTVVFR